MKALQENETNSLKQVDQNFQRVVNPDNFNEEKSGFFQKLRVRKGSISESVINVCIISYGIGLLALPQRVNYLTLVMTPFLIIIFGLINYWTFIVLTDASRKYKVYSYEDIVSTMFAPWVSYFYIFVAGVGLLGLMILFQVILYKFIGGVINDVFSYGYTNIESFANESFWGEKRTRLLICFFITIIIFPLSLIKTFSQMRYLSTFGVFSVFIIIFIVVIQCPSFIYHNVIEEKQKINMLDFSNGFDSDLKFIQSISGIVFAYVCHTGIFPAISGLSNPTKERVQEVFKIETFVIIVSYIIITLSGYLTQPENTPDLILERVKISKNDYFMTLGLFFFSITLVTKVSTSYNCFRSLLLNVMKYDLNYFPNGINFTMTIITLIITTFIAAIFQNISDYISLNGSFYGIIVAVIMPGIIYIKSNDHSIFHLKNLLAIIFIIAFSSIGAFTIYFTLKKILEY